MIRPRGGRQQTRTGRVAPSGGCPTKRWTSRTACAASGRWEGKAARRPVHGPRARPKALLRNSSVDTVDYAFATRPTPIGEQDREVFPHGWHGPLAAERNGDPRERPREPCRRPRDRNPARAAGADPHGSSHCPSNLGSICKRGRGGDETTRGPRLRLRLPGRGTARRPARRPTASPEEWRPGGHTAKSANQLIRASFGFLVRWRHEPPVPLTAQGLRRPRRAQCRGRAGIPTSEPLVEHRHWLSDGHVGSSEARISFPVVLADLELLPDLNSVAMQLYPGFQGLEAARLKARTFFSLRITRPKHGGGSRSDSRPFPSRARVTRNPHLEGLNLPFTPQSPDMPERFRPLHN